MTGNKKRFLNVLLICTLMFGSIGFTQSQLSTAYAMPSIQVAPNRWCVSGEKDLKDDLKLVDSRNCPQGKDHVRSLINTCIRENKILMVHLDILSGGWIYSIAR